LSAERAGHAFTNIEQGISFMGGFDPEDIVFDYSKDTSFLLMFIHELVNFNELVESVGTIDL
jgi:hypothetical protein